MSLEIIDSHQHLWQLDRGLYGWLKPESGQIYRDFAPDDLAPILNETGVSGTILVQAADSEAELPLLVEYARQAGFVRGIVAPLEIAHPQAAARIEAMAQQPLLVGFRPPLSTMVDTDGQLVAHGRAALAAMSDRNLALDCLVRGDALSTLPALAQAFPGLRVVIDHCGAPELGRAAPAPAWIEAMSALARRPNVYVKLSGLPTLQPPGGTPSVLANHIDLLLELFGPERLLWGSDWPVLTLASSYADWLAFCLDRLSAHPEAARREIFAGTARRAYRLDKSLG